MTDQIAEPAAGDILAAWDPETETCPRRMERKLPPQGGVTLTPTTPRGRAVLKSMLRATRRNPEITAALGYELDAGGGRVLVPREGCRWARSFLSVYGGAVHGIAPEQWEGQWSTPA